MARDARFDFMTPGTMVAVVIVSVAAIAPAFSSLGARRAELLADSAAYTLAVTAAVRWAERVRREWLGALLLAAGAICARTIWISHTTALLLAMPLVSLYLLFFSVRASLVVTLLFTAEIVAFCRFQHLDSRSIAQTGLGFVSAAAFTMVFSRLLVRERAAQRQLSEYATQIEDLSAAKERNRIAREIHDGLGHSLTSVSVQIEAARAVLDRDGPRAKEHLERALAMTREGMSDVRRSVAMLRAPAGDKPLDAAVSALVEQCRASGVEVDLKVEGEPRALGPAREFALYRAAQEALTNVRKHANAKRAGVELRYEGAAVELGVRDDGAGATSEPSGGFGLLGVRERVQLVGGTVSIETAPGRGFCLRVRLPA